MAGKKIKINRAPVLTLWATVVAERLGYDEETALTLGKAVAGLNAQSKGRKLGIYEEKTEEESLNQKAHAPIDSPCDVHSGAAMTMALPVAPAKSISAWGTCSEGKMS